MAIPTSRQEFKDYILRRLGNPVTKINVSTDQIEDRIDDAISYWRDYHLDATERVFLSHEISAADITNKFITVPVNIIEVMRILDPGMTFAGSAFFNVKYQFMKHEVFNLAANQTIVPYYVAMRHIDSMNDLLGDKIHFDFNRHSNKCRIHTNWNAISVGTFFVLEAQAILGDDVTELWGDRWLLRYATALTKRQWGENMKKFNEVQLLGGVTFNGQQIYDEAVEEITTLETDMIEKYSFPPLGIIA